MIDGFRRLLDRSISLGDRLEDGLLAVLISVMVLLGAMQIFSRNVLGEGIGWADEVLRIMVLWLALLGAMAASRDRRQLRIDLLSRYLKGRPRHFFDAFADLLTAFVSGVIAWYAFAFVNESKSFGDMLVGSIPAWIVQAILPLAFAVIGARHLRAGMISLMGLLKGDGARE
jgi:TRAP-type C4-dicarboxylate transport system permease small subunit